MLSGIFLHKSKSPIVFIDTYSHYAFYYALFCSLFCQLMSIKYVPILRGGNLPQRLKTNPYLSKIIFNYSLANISPSIFLKIEYEKYGYISKYIPNIIQIENYPFQLRKKCSPKLIWVRSMHKSYNPLMAIKVISELLKIIPSASLFMIGPDKEDGSQSECVKYARELRIEQSIHFTGALKKAKV